MSDNPVMAIDLSTLVPQELDEQSIWRDPKYGVITRVGVLLSMYFAEGHAAAVREGMLQILDEYLRLFQHGVTCFQQEDERRLRRWDGNGVPDVYRKAAFVADQKSSFFLKMLGEASFGTDDPGLYHFLASGFDENTTWQPLSFIKCHFPPTWFYSDIDGFVERVRRWCGLVGCLHGSCGLGALSNSGTELQTEPSHWFLLKRYPGLEFDAVGSYLARSSSAPDHGYRRPRSSNWLTMLGDENLDRVGGRAAVRDLLGPELAMLDYDGGALIRAGRSPQWGDGPKGDIPLAYKQAAALIRPIRFEDYRYGIMNVPDPLDYTAESLAWLRRFD